MNMKLQSLENKFQEYKRETQKEIFRLQFEVNNLKKYNHFENVGIYFPNKKKM